MAQASMDYEGVNGIANGFDAVSDVLRTVSTILEAAITILRVTAFISLGSTEWLRMYLENIKPRVDQLAATCGEMSQDLKAAVQQHRQADEAGAGQFG